MPPTRRPRPKPAEVAGVTAHGGAIRGRLLRLAFAVSLSFLEAPGAAAAGSPGSLASLPEPFGCVRDAAPPPLIGTPLPGCTLGRALGETGPLTISPDGTSAYMAAPDPRPGHPGALVIFRRAPGNGALEQLPEAQGCVSELAGGACAVARGLSSAGEVAVSPDGRNVYVASSTGAGVAAFARDTDSGALTQLPGATGCLRTGGGGGCARARALGGRELALSGDGRSVYVGSGHSLAILARDPASGALSQLPGRRGCLDAFGDGGCAQYRLLSVSDVTVSPDGRNVYVTSLSHEGDTYPYDSITTFRRDERTGALRKPRGRSYCFAVDHVGCDPRQALYSPTGVMVSPDGRNVYVTSSSRAFRSHPGGLAIFSRNRTSGKLRILRGRRGCLADRVGSRCTKARGFSGDSLSSPVASPDGRTVYVFSQQEFGAGNVVAAFARRESDGSLRQLPGEAGCLGGETGCTPGVITDAPEGSLAVSPDSANVYVSRRLLYYGDLRARDIILSALARASAAGTAQ